MTKRYENPATSGDGTAATGSKNDALRPLLWVLLLIGAGGNALVSSIDAGMTGNVMSVVFGAVTIASAAALIVRHYRNRR